MPLQCCGQHGPVSWGGLIKALEQAGAERAPVDDRVVEPQTLERRPVQDAAPLAVAAAIEPIRMFEAQEGFGFAVAGLLAQVGGRRLPTMVPNERPRSEGNPVARLLQAPADIHVVARLAVLRVEAVDRLDRL